MRYPKLLQSIAGITCLILCSGFFFSKPPRYAIVNYGLFTFESQYVIENPDTVAGSESFLDGIRWIEETSTVPAEVGRSFGIEYVINDPDAEIIQVTEIMTFPGIGLTNPETGKTLKVSSHENYFYSGERILMGYGFDEEWEAAEGEWLFQVEYEGEIILEHSFTVK